MTDEIPEALKPIIEKARKKSDTFRKKILTRQLQKFVDREVIAQNVGRQLTVRMVGHIEFGAAAEAVIRWNAINVSWPKMQKFYQTGKPARADDPVYCWCLAWHEVAHFNVPVEKRYSKNGYFRGWRPHGPKFIKYCSERGHHWNVHADVELWRKKGLRLEIGGKWCHYESSPQEDARQSGEHKDSTDQAKTDAKTGKI